MATADTIYCIAHVHKILSIPFLNLVPIDKNSLFVLLSEGNKK